MVPMYYYAVRITYDWRRWNRESAIQFLQGGRRVKLWPRMKFEIH
jgi:hypothetical protein